MDSDLSSRLIRNDNRLPGHPNAPPPPPCFRRSLWSILLVVISVASIIAIVLTMQPMASPKSSRVKALLPERANQGLPMGDPVYPWSNAMLLWQRPVYHFRPEKNWMCDPNAALFYKGWYHFFYQYNPGAAVWGNMSWGHGVSTDLINWFHLPLAMVPDNWFDFSGVWSGSATILPDGNVIILYTGGTQDLVQVQNLAYPANPSDPLLVDWVKYPGNPVLLRPPGIGRMEFRDPMTAWQSGSNTWRTVIGSKDVSKNGGIIFVYETTNFTSYELLDGYMHAVSGTGIWECVDIFPISTTGINGLDMPSHGPGIKYVLKASVEDENSDYYAIGSYDPESGMWTPDDPDMDVGLGLRYDYGKFYASKTFYDQNKKRRILWGWIRETDSEANDLSKGWASVQAIPRSIVFDKKTGTNLLLWPVEELENLRSKITEFKGIELGPGSVVPLHFKEASQLDISAEFEVDKKALERANEADIGYRCNTSSAAVRGALGPFGILVIADDKLSEFTPIYFYVSKGIDGRLKTYFCSDLSRSSKASDVDKKMYGSTVPVLEGENLSMRILVDHSVVESFAQGGRTAISSRVYPTQAIDGSARVFLFNNATGARVRASVKLWEMDSAKHQQFPLD